MMHRHVTATFLFCSVLGVFLQAAGAGEPMTGVSVGAAAVNLKADDSMVIAGGIGPGHSSGQEGELRAVAVVIQKPGFGKIGMVACDVLFTPRDIVDAALSEVYSATGIPPKNILVNATHTHSAPSVTRIHGYDRDNVFAERLKDGIVQAVVEANRNLKDGVRFSFRFGEESTVGANSRQLLDDGKIYWIGSHDHFVRPTGPFDPQLPVLAFRDTEDRLLALLYNHSTHTIGTRGGAVRSPSFYGLAAQELEVELGGIVGFISGASGSTHNITGVTTDEAVLRMKKAIITALDQAEPRPLDRIVCIKRPFTFNIRRFDEAAEDRKVESYCRKYAPSHADYIVDVFRTMRREIEPLQGEQRETWLQVIAVDDLAIVGVPAEFFTGLGIEIKKRSPFPHTFIAALANDWIGYLPDREAHKLGGYQTWMGWHCYAEVGTGERVVEETLAMLEQAAERPE
jgi:neutral ceramidase